ncbi:MAG: CHAT domain-containing protein, partial [Thaumarchaeota archaeon]|nr:CHAT domain-containing protein [Nitrososphaerota archaeon]
MLEYEELRVRAWRIDASAHRYLVFANGPRQAAAAVTLPRQPGEYRKELDRLLQEEFGGSPSHSPLSSGLQALGRDLFAAFFPEPLRDCLEQSVLAVAPKGLRVRFEVPSELGDIPFEILCSPRDHKLGALVLQPRLSVARTLTGLHPLRLPEPSDARARLDVLIVVACPKGVPPLEEDNEIGSIERALPGVVRALAPSVLQRLGPCSQSDHPGATRAKLSERVKRMHNPWAALIIAHGQYDDAARQVNVLLESEEGLPDPVAGVTLAGLLAGAPQLRFVVLNLCLGAVAAPKEPFAGIAHALIRAGIPAVVGMQTEVTNLAARRFSASLLGGIFGNLTVDEALSSARNAMADLGRTKCEWCTPVFFLHEDCGHSWLFKVVQMLPSDGGVLSDPLAEAEKSFREVRERGAQSINDYTLAVQLPRWRRQWDDVKTLADAALRDSSGIASFEHILEEARGELVLQGSAAAPNLRPVQTLCELLESDNTNLSDVHLRLAGLRRHLPASLFQCFRSEVDHRMAVDAASRGQWQKAHLLYAEIQQRETEDRDVQSQMSYVQGRLAETQGKWGDAVTHYQFAAEERNMAPPFHDATRRFHYARGRDAEREEDRADWATAIEAYEKLRLDWDDVALRLPYARGRALEGTGCWRDAEEVYVTPHLAGHRDTVARALYAHGRAAVNEGNWTVAMMTFDRLGNAWDALHWYEEACARQYSQACQAENESRWENAVAAFTVLPQGFADVEPRCVYARGRAAEYKEQWSDAVDAYRATSLHGFRDAGLRECYVSARQAEALADWGEALRLLTQLSEQVILPQGYSDIRERVLYARGLEAESREDWSSLTEGFGDLPDTYRDGQVGPLRRYARARLDEKRGRWTGILEDLLDVPDGYRDGEVGCLRRYAQARLHESQGDWNLALVTYEGIPGPFRDLEYRHGYATGRAGEVSEDWETVFHAFAKLPSAYEDVVLRFPYAQGRFHEVSSRWTEAVAAYERLPPDYQDMTSRLAYAKARVAEENANWPAVVSFLGDLDESYRDVTCRACYAAGQIAEAREDWKAAANAYNKCLDYQDAHPHHAYAKGRFHEAKGEWSAAVDWYEIEEALFDSDDRRQRLAKLLNGLPWANGLASDGLVADPLSTRDAVAPYLALRQAGITPVSSADEIMDASFTLMERGAMTHEARLAWDQLRTPRNRVRVDAFLYRLRDPDGLRRSLQDLSPGSQGEALTILCMSLTEDAPLFMLLAGRR